MVAAVETMAYANQVPWHGLGKPVNDDLTPKQMCKQADIAWRIDKVPLYFDKNGTMTEIKDKFALVRSTDKSVLSVVGTHWKVIQNEEAIDFFKKFVKSGKMKMETAGSLRDGRYVWALARITSDFKLGKSDEIHSYLLLCIPHVLGKAFVIQFTPIRVVCWNTLSFALGTNLKGNESAFRMPHSVEFNDKVRAAAEAALGLATEQTVVFKEAAQLLSKKKAKLEEVNEYFCEVLKFDPKKAEKKKDGEVKVPRALPKIQEALTYAPGQNLNTAEGTWWGALNAVTYVVDHELGRDRSAALSSAWLGQKAALKRRALDLALKHAA